MRVLVIGAGLGGLCLANGLRRAGVDVAVFERDAAAEARGQGYRIGLKEAGTGALRDCLPADLYALCAATALRTATRMVFTDEQLNPKFAKPIPPSPPSVFGVHRRTLREILLAGLPDFVHFGRTCTGYGHTPDGRVVAHFADGTSETGDVLVGADGTGSAVRAQLLPDAQVDVLEHAVHGRTPLAPGALAAMPDVLVDTFNRVIGADGAAVAVATCRLREPAESAAARLAPGVRLTPVPDHFTWTFTAPGVDLPTEPAALHAVAVRTVEGWHPAVRRIVAEADTVFPVAITSARPVPSWDEPGVTLLGDAVHTMSPGRGDGANVALEDAALLAHALAGVAAGRRTLADALRDYQAEMLARGFAAVERSRTAPFAPRTPARSV